MKILLNILVFLLVSSSLCRSQESTLLLSKGMFSREEVIYIGTMDGWLFKQGHDPSWSLREIDLSDWIKLNPATLTSKQADFKGKVEGWFRFRIRLDSTLYNMPLGLRFNGWAAINLYIDGKLIQSLGNTGEDGSPFKEYIPVHKYPVPIHLDPGIEHIIALHIVDFISPFPPFRLKSGDVRRLKLFIGFTSSEFNSRLSKHIKDEPIYSTLSISIWSVLCLLFCLLAAQNPGEKNLRSIVMCSALFALAGFCQKLTHHPDISFVFIKINLLVISLCFNLLLVIIPLLIVQIFKQKIPRFLNYILAVFFLCGIINLFYTNELVIVITACLLFGICVFYIVSSWKTLKGAEWFIITGLMLNLVWLFIIFGYMTKYKILPSNVDKYMSGAYLSFPVSLLFYVAFRFKEIFSEVKENALQVLKLSEEKKNQTLMQQKLVEEEVSRQTAELISSVDHLKSTQSQLIQAEKMASIGEFRQKIAADLHDEIGSSLSSMAFSAELVKKKLDGTRKDIEHLLNNLVSNSKETSSLISDTIWSLNPKNDSFEKLKEHMKNFTQEILFSKEIEYQFDTNDRVPSPILSLEQKRNIYLIYKEAINNVAKHSKARQAHILFETLLDKLNIEISDNGIGFDINKGYQGNGLKNFKARSHKESCEVYFSSIIGKGTVVKIMANYNSSNYKVSTSR